VAAVPEIPPHKLKKKKEKFNGVPTFLVDHLQEHRSFSSAGIVQSVQPLPGQLMIHSW
jgi:hypothetical protein